MGSDKLGEEGDGNFASGRNINVYFNVLKGRVYDGFILKVEPRNSVIDHTFRYFERDNRQVSLVLPALYYFSQAPISKYFLCLFLKLKIQFKAGSSHYIPQNFGGMAQRT